MLTKNFDRLGWPTGLDVGRASFRIPKFLVVGHRGSGMNMLQSADRRMKAIKENSIASFNTAGKFAVDFVEFDVQVRFPRQSSAPRFMFSFRLLLCFLSLMD